MELLYALESIRTPFLDKLMGLVTNLGGEAVFIAAAIIVFWCLNKSCGYYMMTVGFAGTIINQFLKLWFRIPRPWVKDPNFTIVESARAEATGYFLPQRPHAECLCRFRRTGKVFKNTALRIVLYFHSADGILPYVCPEFTRRWMSACRSASELSSFLSYIRSAAIWTKARKKGLHNIRYIHCSCCGICRFRRLYDFPADIDAENYASGLKNAYMILFCAIGLMLTFFIDTKSMSASPRRPCGGRR